MSFMELYAIRLIILLSVFVLSCLNAPCGAENPKIRTPSVKVEQEKRADALSQLQQKIELQDRVQTASFDHLKQKLEKIEQSIEATKNDRITNSFFKDCPAVVVAASLTAWASVLGAVFSGFALWVIAKSITDKHNDQSLKLQEKQHDSSLELQRIQHTNVVEFTKLQHIQKLGVDQITALEKFLPHLTSKDHRLRAAALEIVLFLGHDELIWQVLGVVLGKRDGPGESAAVRSQEQLATENFDLQIAINEAKSSASITRRS